MFSYVHSLVWECLTDVVPYFPWSFGKLFLSFTSLILLLVQLFLNQDMSFKGIDPVLQGTGHSKLKVGDWFAFRSMRVVVGRIGGMALTVFPLCSLLTSSNLRKQDPGRQWMSLRISQHRDSWWKVRKLSGRSDCCVRLPDPAMLITNHFLALLCARHCCGSFTPAPALHLMTVLWAKTDILLSVLLVRKLSMARCGLARLQNRGRLSGIRPVTHDCFLTASLMYHTPVHWKEAGKLHDTW